jgi:glycosyltransferase involved in cell wall biosynthesis
MTADPIQMLFFLRESFPTPRPDVTVLFGDELLGRGHQIDFVMQSAADADPVGPRGWHGRTVWVGATDGGDGFLHRVRRQALALRHDLRLLREAHTEHYRAVQVRDKFLIAALLAWLAPRRGLKFFYWLSFPEPESLLQRVRERSARYPLATWIRGKLFTLLLYQWILPRCDHAFVQSEQMRRDLSARGVDPGKLTPVPMGVAPADFPAPAAARANDGAQLTLAYLGTLNAQRRLEILLDMLALLRQRHVDARLLLIGGGDEPEDLPRLQQRAAELGLGSQVEFTGLLGRDAALARVRQADICLSPFFPTPVLRSTSPTKLVEYLALGIPVVANDHPEQRVVLQQSAAGVCVPWGARHFARGVAWLAARGPRERHRMGEQGREWVLANRAYPRIADLVEAQYRQLLQGAPRSKVPSGLRK